MTYEIVWDPKAIRCLKKLEKKWASEIIRKLKECAETPFLFLKKLKNTTSWRLRVGDFRVILDLHTEDNKMHIITLGHRKDIYDEV